ncbi:hypothetical protein K3495_g4794 [Podosphaera aphanis]|nr:hypothetical protein K3495_g4794 [Podosphaera aphanis]
MSELSDARQQEVASDTCQDAAPPTCNSSGLITVASGGGAREETFVASPTPGANIPLGCPCSESTHLPRTLAADRVARAEEGPDEEDEEERTFDLRSPRSNFTLYPVEHLLYCEDCQQIRCPRCVLDEIVTWYCPNCLFEVPSSTVKSEGNRCTRSCFQCPICTAPLAVSSLEPLAEGLGAKLASPSGPYILNCTYCRWTTQEIGIYFEKPNGIFAQLAKVKNGGEPMIPAKDRRRDSEKRKDGETRRRRLTSPPMIVAEDELSPTEKVTLFDPNEELDPESQFSNLKAFYQSQLAESSSVNPLGLSGDYNYGSPGSFLRIMGYYSGGSSADKRAKVRTSVMREAGDALEGLQILSLAPNADDKIINHLRSGGWDSTTTSTQRQDSTNFDKRFLSDLRPIPCLLRTKRSKRCRTCRHILSKPEAKLQSTRFRIRLIALNYVPSISIKHLHTTTQSLLTPMKPVQFLLTFKNPLFDRVKVTLATPAQTPGRFPSKVTILCPEFEIGANTDVWDEALREDKSNRDSISDKRKTKTEASEGQPQAEAGKAWEKGRNWVSIVLEVILGNLKLDVSKSDVKKDLESEKEFLKEDDDICEIPVFVRVEWETDTAHDEASGLMGTSKASGFREKRELAYWCVLGVGRIAQD